MKARLEALEEDLIPYGDYLTLCHNEGINDDISQRTLIGFLHDLGVVLNYHDDPRLEDTNILNPEWVTNGVYSILNSNTLFQRKGVLERRDLPEILDPVRYPKNKYSFIVEMMRRFELCFDFEGFADEKFLIPDLLPREEPYTGDWDDALTFEYHYDVLPSSVISRFIVRMHSHVYKNTYWRNGVVLQIDGNAALVKADKEDRRIFVSIKGPERGRRNLLGTIRAEFESIHRTIPALKVAEKVRLPRNPEIAVDYNYLLDLEEMGEDGFVPEGMKERVSVSALLDGFQSQSERRERVNSSNRIEEEPGPVAARPGRVESPVRPPSGARAPAAIPAPRVTPWASGMFYLVTGVVVLLTIAAVARMVPWYVLATAIVGALIAMSIIGALQLRQDERLSEANLVKVILTGFKVAPRSVRRGPSNGEKGNA